MGPAMKAGKTRIDEMNIKATYGSQRSPALHTAKYGPYTYRDLWAYLPEWSPVTKTRKTRIRLPASFGIRRRNGARS